MVHSKKKVVGCGLAAAGFLIAALLIAGAAMGGDGGLADDRIADIGGIGSGGALAASSVSSNITYQGRLTDSSGNPLSGTYNMTFRIWNAASGGSALWKDTHWVNVTYGLFSTTIAVDPMDFDGQALWLGIQVGEDSPMTPRQELRPVPYALSLRPGATINGSAAGTSLNNLEPGVKISTRYDYNPGVLIETEGLESRGVLARTYGKDSEGFYAHTYGNLSEGFYAVTEGEESEGVFAYTYGDRSDGVYVDTAGNESAGVLAHSTKYYAIIANTRREDHDYAFYTHNDNIYVGGKIDLVGGIDPIIVEGFNANPLATYEVGDVMCLAESGSVKPCLKADDTRVVGVVGPTVELEDGEITVVIMGHQGAKPDEEYVQLLEAQLESAEVQKAKAQQPTLTGKFEEAERLNSEIAKLRSELDEAKSVTRQVVRVKADASYGSIKAGDLLTTSATLGHAMKAQPVDLGGVEIYRPGTIIGKALEPLESGTRLIEVFVTLQ